MTPSIRKYSVWLLATILGLMVGCRPSSQSNAEKEPPITGKPTDPPAVLVAEWKPDRRYVMRLETSMKSQWDLGRQTTVQETSAEQEYGLTVTNTPDGGRGIEMEILSLTVDAHMNDQNVLFFDSLNKAVPSKGPGTDLLARLVGGRVGFQLDADNNIVSVDGISKLFERAAEPASGQAGDVRFGGASAILERIYNEDYFKQIVNLTTLPRSAVRIGDSWTVERVVEVGMVGNVILNTTNTLRGWQERGGKQCARIESNGAFGLKSGKAEGLLAMVSLNLENSRIHGRTWFDPELGLPLESVIEQSCTLTGQRPNWGRRAPDTNSAPARFSSPWHMNVSLKVVETSSLPRLSSQ